MLIKMRLRWWFPTFACASHTRKRSEFRCFVCWTGPICLAMTSPTQATRLRERTSDAGHEAEPLTRLRSGHSIVNQCDAETNASSLMQPAQSICGASRQYTVTVQSLARYSTPLQGHTADLLTP